MDLQLGEGIKTLMRKKKKKKKQHAPCVGCTCGGGWSMADTSSAGLFSGHSNSTGIFSCNRRHTSAAVQSKPCVIYCSSKRVRRKQNKHLTFNSVETHLCVSVQCVSEGVCVVVLQQPLLQVVVAELGPAGRSLLGRVSGVP